MTQWRCAGALLGGFLALAPRVGAAPETEPVPDIMAMAAAAEKSITPVVERQPSWGFTATLGYGGAGGDFGGLLEKPVSGDFNLFRQRGSWRYGLGLSFSSFKMKTPHQDEPEWGFQQTYLFATRMLLSERSVVRPYIQVRGGLARLHPRSELFAFQPPPPENSGDSPTKPSNGFSVGLVPGFETRLNKSLALDLSAQLDWFSVDEYDLSPVHRANASSGTKWEARIGLRWNPDDGYPSGPARAGSPARPRDAWGVGRNLGWGIAEVLAINWVSSGVNEYVRNANFNQVSPRSWWYNLDHGLTYDDNEFKTNQYLHPWNGAMYYNTGRANGFGYWSSSLFAFGGAFFWECCGETHPMSLNDLVSTGFGGIAVGEQMHRLSSQLLNNQDTGKSRFFREAGSFLINPVRGLNRAISGRFMSVHDNPEEPLDFRPPHARFFVFTGARVIGEGESITENTKTYGFIGLNHSYGSVFDNERRKPFDSMVSDYQFSPGEKQARTLLRIRGDIWSRPLGKGPDPNYAFAIVQHFDYYNNAAYEFGQQAFGPSLFARYRLSNKLGLGLRWDGMIALLSAVNSDYSFLAQVADRERFREYDYGPGLGTGLEVRLTHSSHEILGLYYRLHYINVSNGSIFNKTDERNLQGSDADHTLQAAGARLYLPVFRRMGLGADGLVVLRKSHYTSPLLQDHDQRNPEFRVYLAFDFVH
jgi:hypothetical protein